MFDFGKFINTLNPVNIGRVITTEIRKPAVAIGDIINNIGRGVVDAGKSIGNFIGNLPPPQHLVKEINKVTKEAAKGARDVIIEVGGGAGEAIGGVVGSAIKPISDNPMLTGSVLAGSLSLPLIAGAGLLGMIFILR